MSCCVGLAFLAGCLCPQQTQSIGWRHKQPGTCGQQVTVVTGQWDGCSEAAMIVLCCAVLCLALCCVCCCTVQWLLQIQLQHVPWTRRFAIACWDNTAQYFQGMNLPPQRAEPGVYSSRALMLLSTTAFLMVLPVITGYLNQIHSRVCYNSLACTFRTIHLMDNLSCRTQAQAGLT